MKGIATFGGAVSAIASTALATPLEQRSTLAPVTTNGNAFFVNGERFYIRGVDYQPGGAADPVDPLANPATCQRDIALFKELGINTVRIYTVDNTANHDVCMNALADAGIYLALDVNNGLYSLNRDDPAPSYNNVYLQSVFATIDEFASYSNTLLFFSGNEVINAPNNTDTAPYVKAVTRDMKKYIAARNYRQIPVGYSAADVTQNRVQTAEYMNCGPDGMARSDFFAFNDYSWCGKNTFQGSGWAANVQTYNKYSIPLFLSEYGCNQVLPRTFEEVQALYNPEMTGVYSGGLVYEYSEESDNPNFGLVQITGNTAKPLGDFTRFQQQLKANPAPTGSGGFKENLPISQCPAKSAMWNVKGEALPNMPKPAEKYFKNGAGKGPGLSGTGSQTAGTPSAGWSSVSEPDAQSAKGHYHFNGSDSPSTGGAGSLKPASALVAISMFLVAMLL